MGILPVVSIQDDRRDRAGRMDFTGCIPCSTENRRNNMNQNVKDRFLTYVSFDTQSDSASTAVPSTEKQLKLAAYLADELKGLGLHDVEMDQYACVYAHIPASAGCTRPGLALIAHMDTAMDMSGANIKPRIVAGYDGGDIVLNHERILSPGFPIIPAWHSLRART